MKKILKCYPFIKEDPPVVLVEGFEAYDGVIGDQPGAPHKGIDFVRQNKKGKYISFDVFSCHDGETFQGLSKSWGKFVSIRKRASKNKRMDTIYTHFKKVNSEIPFFSKDKEKKKGLEIKTGEYLGKAGTTGKTNRIIQLHFELLEKNLKKKQLTKIDPYGIYKKASSGEYPQPGESLKGLRHYWAMDNPPFAKKTDASI